MQYYTVNIVIVRYLVAVFMAVFTGIVFGSITHLHDLGKSQIVLLIENIPQYRLHLRECKIIIFCREERKQGMGIVACGINVKPVFVIPGWDCAAFRASSVRSASHSE